jgi:hypothetical protein
MSNGSTLRSRLILEAGGFVLLLGLLGCGPNDLHKLAQDTKQQHKAADVQAALAPFFVSQRTLTNRLPVEITSLPIFADDPTKIEVSRTLESSNVLMLTIGSGFGHWGLLVARPGHEQEISKWHRDRLKSWDDGVFFFFE